MLLLTDLQQVDLSVAFTDAAGNPAPVDGAPVWSSSDETVLTVTASADGMTATAVTTGKLGQAQISVTGDADLGAGTTSVAGTLDVTVQASAAVAANIGAGTPTDKVPATPPTPPTP